MMVSSSPFLLLFLSLSLAPIQLVTSAVLRLPTPNTCSPTFSGLVQSITASGKGQFGLRSYGKFRKDQSEGMGIVSIPSKMSSSLSLKFEWFVEHGIPPLTYSLRSGAAVASCLFASGIEQSKAQQRFSPQFSPTSIICPDSIEMNIKCQTCEPNEDSGFRCQLQKIETGLCVELNGKTLKWAPCAEREGYSLDAQSFDIRPS